LGNTFCSFSFCTVEEFETGAEVDAEAGIDAGAESGIAPGVTETGAATAGEDAAESGEGAIDSETGVTDDGAGAAGADAMGTDSSDIEKRSGSGEAEYAGAGLVGASGVKTGALGTEGSDRGDSDFETGSSSCGREC